MIAVSTSANAAKAVLARHGKTFALASKFMGDDTAARAAKLYAFCRHLDDLVDERVSVQAARDALDRTRNQLVTGHGSDPVVDDFLCLARDALMDPTLGVILVDGLESDLGHVAIESPEELIRYAYRVAGVVGLMMCAVMNVRDNRALPFAIDLGIAMQFTNIARDIREDAAMGRRYIPGEWIQNLGACDLVVPTEATQAPVRRALEQLLNLADRYYSSAARGLHYIPTRSRLAIRIAGSVYREIGQLIRERDFSVSETRTVVGPARKAVVSARALLIDPLRAHQPDASNTATEKLHSALRGLPGVRSQDEDSQECLA